MRHPRVYDGAVASVRTLGTVARGAFSTAAIGATPDDDFEIGSISKTITGLLYADAVSLPSGMHPARRTWDLWRRGMNPYGDSLEDLLAQARATGIGRPRYRYSNLGFELLGHAVASAQGASYRDLLRTSLTEPLGLVGTYVPHGVQDLGLTALPGYSRRGRARDPWTGEALAPAGGVRAPRWRT